MSQLTTEQIDLIDTMIEELNELINYHATDMDNDGLAKAELNLTALEMAKDNVGWMPFEGAPKNGKPFYVRGYYKSPFKWKPYSKKSQQYKRGIKGRWQEMNEYGGWDNATFTPEEWQPHPDDLPTPPKESE